MSYTNNSGQTRVGVRRRANILSSLMTGIYGAWNADTLDTSLDTNIYGAWNGDSNTNDSYGSNHGTAQGGLTYTTGKIGNAFTFNGTNAYVSLPNNSLNLTGDFSYSFWFNPSQVGVEKYLISNYNSVASGGHIHGTGFIIAIQTNNRIGIAIYNTGFSTLYSSESLSANTWYHVVITRKYATGTKVYINGTLSASDTSTKDPIYPSSTYQSTIGQSPGYSGYVNGKIDALSIWNKELSQDEITQLYNIGNGVQYPFSSQTLPSSNDAVGTNNGTLVNGATFTDGKIGQAFQFDGVNDYVNFQNDYFKPTNSFSANFWINTNNSSTEQTIFTSVASNGYLGWRVFISGGAVTFRTFPINTSFNQLSTGTSKYTASSWYMITVINDLNNGMMIYVNGNLEASNTIKQAISWGSTTINKLGQNWNNGTVFNGKIDSISFWSRSLTSSEVTELYNSGNGKQYPY